ncbi:carbohydrate kinase family protein [Azomonas macrocytogenes]|uniref:Fructokinase n=1 Tax=Azomonas macrocytogenes TaxID=69962 RepID=A0A839T863_AZOMA|nr:carbohydrate kinase [Azomonas macrocytogenes]MBB3105050.1 fructokinase [Azomonas macrocytogenes]
MFLVCGEALFDLFVDPAHSEFPGKVGFTAIAGGSPFNVAVGLSRLGVGSALLTGVSNDFLGQQLRQVLENEGVSTHYLAQPEATSTTLSLVAVDKRGVPHYSFYGHSGADRQLLPSHVPEIGKEIRGIHVGSYSLVVAPTAGTLYELVHKSSQDRLITLDPNVRLNVEPDLDVWRERITAFAQHAHIIKVSEEDLELLYPGQDPQVIAATLLANQCQLVCLTHGENGSSVFTRNHGNWTSPACQINTIDTVGAGDTFQAALITYLLENGFDTPATLATLQRAHIEAMIDFATQAAALTCQRHGPDLPRRHELPRAGNELQAAAL